MSGIEILFSGLCVVSLTASAGVYEKVGVSCPHQMNHVSRLTLNASQITGWPDGLDADWFVTPDGSEYVAIEIFALDVKPDGTQAALTVKNDLKELLSFSDFNAKKSGTPMIKFAYEFSKGAVEAVGPTNVCVRVPANTPKDDKSPYENLSWKLVGSKVDFFVNGWADPVTIEGNSIQALVSNDVRITEDPTPAVGDEFHHWTMVPALWNGGTEPTHLNSCVSAAGLTSRPICNLILEK